MIPMVLCGHRSGKASFVILPRIATTGCVYEKHNISVKEFLVSTRTMRAVK